MTDAEAARQHLADYLDSERGWDTDDVEEAFACFFAPERRTAVLTAMGMTKMHAYGLYGLTGFMTQECWVPPEGGETRP